MITPPTNSFFVIHVKGEATDHVVSKLAPSTMADIREAILISNDYTSDIQAHVEMDVAVEKLKSQLGRSDIFEHTQINPLYVPSTQDQVDQVLESDPAGDSFKFVGMDNNPYTMRSVDLSMPDCEILVAARTACHEFPLPSYSEIISAQKNVRLQ